MTLEQDIAAALNRASAENGSNTPDFILARYLIACLAAWNVAVVARAHWYHPRPGTTGDPTVLAETRKTISSHWFAPGFNIEACDRCGLAKADPVHRK